MQHVASQLKAVRQAGRVLLVLRRVAQLLSVLLPLALVLGLLDYALRLPGPMRLLIGLLLIGGAGYWLFTRLNRALRFWPSLAELALRAERLYPQLAGSLASAVEFSMEPAGYAEPQATASMAESTVKEMQTKSKGVDLKRLIKLKPTMQSFCLALLALAVLVTVVSFAPGASATAASRWFMPLGDAQWPKVNQVQALTADQVVFPADGKVRLRAKVTRGWSDGMRMTIRYRVLDQAGEGEWVSINVAKQRNTADTDQHIYETMVDVPPAIARSLMSGQRSSATLEVRYAAGDDTSDTQSLTIAARPEITGIIVTTSPPDYALSLLGEQRTPLHEQPERIASTSAYIGSRVKLDVRFNKAIPREQANEAAAQWIAQAGPNSELELSGSDDLADGFELHWVLRETVAGSFDLVDDFGLRSTDSDKQYRVQAIEDEDPMVVLLRPAMDESVLPGATVQLKAMAEDDVAMQSLRLDVLVPDRENTPEDAIEISTRLLKGDGLLTTGRSESLDVEYALNLQPLALLPGDEVLVTAIGQDVYKLDGLRHDEVASETRRLRVITEQELADQIRRVLRGVRSTAQSMERKQRLVANRSENTPPAETAQQQGDITRRIAAQQDTIDALRERLDRNQPKGLDGLDNLLDRAEELLDKSRDASDQAEESLKEATDQQRVGEKASQAAQEKAEAGDAEQAQKQRDQEAQAKGDQKKANDAAKEAQDDAREQLAELVAALDMGESVGEIESELSAIRSDAERIAKDTRELLSKTIGQDRDALPEDLKKELEKNAQKQRALAERAEELIDKMRATADEIGNEGETPEQRATAKTLSKAADIAQRQGLKENTEKAAEQLDKNQVADAATKQQQAMATLDQMLAELGKQKERRQEELKRLLQELAQKIQKSAEEQREQLALTEETQADALGVLEQPQFTLRKRTMLIEAQAMQSPDTEAVGELLGEAVRDQSEAVKAIRVADKESTLNAQAAALAHLEEALASINKKQDEEQQDKQREERFALQQAYKDLADKQQALATILKQHQRDEDYSRRDWRQINRLYEEALDEKAFDEYERSIRLAALELKEKAGEAIIYQSLHRRIDAAANRAENRLSDRLIDDWAIDEMRQVEQMLRAMADALEQTGNPDKFEKDDGGQKPGGEGGPGGEPKEPPLVPDLAQIRLLREVMIILRNQTASIDAAGAKLTPEDRAAALAELAKTQRELKELGDQLIEKLREQMQVAPAEPRN